MFLFKPKELVTAIYDLTAKTTSTLISDMTENDIMEIKKALEFFEDKTIKERSLDLILNKEKNNG